MFSSLRIRLLGLVFGVIVFTSVVIIFLVKQKIENTFIDTYNQNALSQMNLIEHIVSNQYSSIQFHKESILQHRKNELKQKIELAEIILKKYHQQFNNGFLTEKKAKQLALNDISKMRYDNNIGYFWINNIQRPFPKMIMHPTLPELDEQILDDIKFNCALGTNENLFKAFVDVCLEENEGFVDYLWPKPTSTGLTSDQPKISFVKLFKSWNWIVGTGVYIDDIDKEVNLRVNAVIKELNHSIGKYKLDHDGYIYIFNGNAELIVHPYLSKKKPNQINNWLTGKKLFYELIKSKDNSTPYIDYNWTKENDTVNFIYKKRAYISYYKPLDWYIASSYYVDSISTPIKNFSKNIIYIVFALFVFGFIVSMILASSITKPLSILSQSVQKIKVEGVPQKLNPIRGSSEIVNFSNILNSMISSIHKTQKAQKESEEKLRHYIEYAPDPIIVLSETTNIIKFNKKVVSTFNYTESEISNLQLKEIIHSDHQALFDSFIQEIKSNRSAESEINFINKNKLTIPCLISAVLLQSDDIVIFIKNITEIKLIQKKLEEAKIKAEESNRLKTAFLANMSHEIRTPMNGIIGFSQLLSDPELSNRERVEYAEIIENSSMQLLRVVNDIVDISKIETGQIELKLQQVNCHDFIKEMHQAYYKRALEKDLDLKYKTDPQSNFTILLDYTKIRQVIDNLLNNAFKYTEKGSIELGYYFIDEKFIFYVKDTGIGLKKEDQKIIFDRFTQAESNKGGTGLGLAISKAYIDLMGGDFWVESEYNKGATFYLSIPIKAPIN